MKECSVLPKPSRHQKCPWGSALCCQDLPQGHGAAGCFINQSSQYRCQPWYQELSPGQQWAFSSSSSNLRLV